MATAKRRVGRPVAKLTALGRWIEKKGWTREYLAEQLGIARQSADRLCRGDRRPGLETALQIEKVTGGDVPVSTWKSVPPHKRD